jgi:hypothetical protein
MTLIQQSDSIPPSHPRCPVCAVPMWLVSVARDASGDPLPGRTKYECKVCGGAVDNPFRQEVLRRFGLVPNFFMTARDAPEVVEKLWDFAKSAYLDNPMPSLFKERLFVFLSRFCPVRYCIVRHCGFLVGYGHASGDPAVHAQTIDQVIHLLKVPSPWRREIEPIYEGLAAIKTPIDWPAPGSDLEDWIFAAAVVIFVEPHQSERPQMLLRNVLGGKRYEYLLALLTFIRAAHYWTVVHPGLEIENDVMELMRTHKELASLLLQDPDVGRSDQHYRKE